MIPVFDTEKECFSLRIKEVKSAEKGKRIKKLSGVYAIFSFKCGFLYIGTAENISNRILFHIAEETTERIKYLPVANSKGEITYYPYSGYRNTLIDKIKEDTKVSSQTLFDSLLIVFPIGDYVERYSFEKKLIKEKKPRYNVTYNN
jgi:hypothetical protein